MPYKKIPKNSKNKRPSFPFYPADWRGDLKLQFCSFGAKGLWMDLMCIMHDSDKYGYLLIDGEKPTDEDLAFLFRVDIEIFRKYFLEIKDKKIIKKNNEGIYYSKRLVNDFKLRELSKKYGKLGGNPKLKGVKDRVIPPGYPSSEKEIEIEDEIENEPVIEIYKQEEFEKIYRAYPGNRRGIYIDCLEIYKNSVRNEEILNQFKKAINNYNGSEEFKNKRIMNFDKFLLQWENWVEHKNTGSDPNLLIKTEKELRAKIKARDNAK